MLQSGQAHFDLIITDFIMPEMTGVELAKEALKVRPDFPIILCTGLDKKASEEEVKNIGIRGLAMKPLDRRYLAKLVRSVLDGEM